MNNKICFPSYENIHLRTKESFLSKNDEEFHSGDSLLLTLPDFDPIKNVPLDYMHLICLGVMKKLLLDWVSGKPKTKLSSLQAEKLNSRLLNLRMSIPIEFSRKPRRISELKRWKATEFRTFLLYLGPLVLKHVLNKKRYSNFMDLHVATFIFVNIASLDDKSKLIDYGHNQMVHFIKTFGILYGTENINHNVHNLIHLAEDVKTFGPLDGFSCFKYENYLQILKRQLRKGDKALAQIVKRVMEKDKVCKAPQQGQLNFQSNLDCPHLANEHNKGPVLGIADKQFKELRLQNYVLRNFGSNSYCRLRDLQIVKIRNFITLGENSYVIGNVMKVENMYSSPCASSLLGIFQLICTNVELVSHPINVIKEKVVALEQDDICFLFVMNN